jgi:hypothetical protein
MVDGTLLPIIAGLAVGIAFVVLFSAMLKSIDAMTDDELRRLVSNQYPQFEALKERYPDTPVQRIERYPWATYVHYEATKEPRDENTVSFPGPRVLAITLTIKPLGPLTLHVSCGSGLSTDLPATVQAIKTTDCLETGSNVGVYEPDNSGDELNQIDLLTFGSVFDFNFREKQLTVAVNTVDGKSIAFRSAVEIEPAVIARYPILQEMIEEADKSGTKESVIIYRNISGSEAEFLIDGKLAFTQTRLELVRYDEVSTLINFGGNTSYLIRVFEADNSDPFALDDDTDDETGMFEPETDVGDPIPVEVSTGNETSIEITYNEN